MVNRLGSPVCIESEGEGYDVSTRTTFPINEPGILALTFKREPSVFLAVE